MTNNHSDHPFSSQTTTVTSFSDVQQLQCHGITCRRSLGNITSGCRTTMTSLPDVITFTFKRSYNNIITFGCRTTQRHHFQTSNNQSDIGLIATFSLKLLFDVKTRLRYRLHVKKAICIMCSIYCKYVS